MTSCLLHDSCSNLWHLWLCHGTTLCNHHTPHCSNPKCHDLSHMWLMWCPTLLQLWVTASSARPHCYHHPSALKHPQHPPSLGQQQLPTTVAHNRQSCLWTSSGANHSCTWNSTHSRHSCTGTHHMTSCLLHDSCSNLWHLWLCHGTTLCNHHTPHCSNPKCHDLSHMWLMWFPPLLQLWVTTSFSSPHCCRHRRPHQNHCQGYPDQLCRMLATSGSGVCGDYSLHPASHPGNSIAYVGRHLPTPEEQSDTTSPWVV